MPSQQNQIHAMPYVAGMAYGVLRRPQSLVTADTILIVQMHEIGSWTSLPAGFVVVDGAPLSHKMIGLFSHGIPTVIISHQQLARLEEGQSIQLDGTKGTITFRTDETVPAPSAAAPELSSVSADGIPISLRASIRNVAGARRAVEVGVDAIGLVRSEFFLPADDSIPGPAHFHEVFAELCSTVSPLPITIRLLDIAPDKYTSLLAQGLVGGSLGMQGSRLFGTEPVRSIVLAQLAAIDTLSQDFDIRLLLPYLVRREELLHWADWINQRLSRPLPIGAMVETPASALDFGNWFNFANFISLGCNDLMQCFFAADRDRPELRSYLDPYAPPLFRFLGLIAPSEPAIQEKVQLCGLLSQLPGVLPILLGLGYRSFSVDAALVPYLKEQIHATRVDEAQALAAEVCSAKESSQVLALLGLEQKQAEPFIAG